MKLRFILALLFVGQVLMAQNEKIQYMARVSASWFKTPVGLCTVGIVEGDCASSLAIWTEDAGVYSVIQLECGLKYDVLDPVVYNKLNPYHLEYEGSYYMSSEELIPMNPFEGWHTIGNTLIKEFWYEGTKHWIHIEMDIEATKLLNSKSKI